MTMAKRTYSLPAETMERFESQIAPGKRSAKVIELIEAWSIEQHRLSIRESVAAGCKDMWDDYLEIANVWEPLDREVDRIVELHP